MWSLGAVEELGVWRSCSNCNEIKGGYELGGVGIVIR